MEFMKQLRGILLRHMSIRILSLKRSALICLTCQGGRQCVCDVSVCCCVLLVCLGEPHTHMVQDVVVLCCILQQQSLCLLVRCFT